MTEKIIDGSIVEKIMKVLAMQQSPNQNEAATALARAQKMLLRHNLTMEDIERYQKEEKGEYSYKTLKLGSSRKWRRGLANIIAMNFLCEAIYFRKTSQVGIVGLPKNIDVVLQVVPFVERQIDMMADVAFGRQGYGSKTAWKDSFCAGAVRTIQLRLEQGKEEFIAEGESSRALIVLNDKAVKEAVKRFFTDVRYDKPQRKDYVPSAYNEGRRQGHNVKIFKEIQ